MKNIWLYLELTSTDMMLQVLTEGD